VVLLASQRQSTVVQKWQRGKERVYNQMQFSQAQKKYHSKF